MRPADFSGKQFGQWYVMGRAPDSVCVKYGKSKVRWSIRCVCGKEKIVSSGNFGENRRTGGCRSCANRRRALPYQTIYKKMRNHATSRGLEIAISFEEFVEFTKVTSCSYCGADIKWSQRTGKSTAYNLDRIDCARGYTKDNVVVACPLCNRTRSNSFTVEEFKIIGLAIKEIRRLRGIQ